MFDRYLLLYYVVSEKGEREAARCDRSLSQHAMHKQMFYYVVSGKGEREAARCDRSLSQHAMHKKCNVILLVAV